MVTSAGIGVEPDARCRCPWLTLLARRQPLHKVLVSFDVPWGPFWPLDTKGCIFPVCPGHTLWLSKDVPVAFGHFEGCCVPGQPRGKGASPGPGTGAVLQLGDCR